MDITPNTRTVIDYSCTFTSEDVQLARDDPFSFGEKFREALLALDPKPATNGNGKHPNRVHLQLGTKSRDPGTAGRGISGRAGKRAAKKSAKPKAPKAGANRAKNQGAFACPQCGQRFSTEGFLARHLRQIHGQAAGSSSEVAASAPTWQKAPASAAE